MAPEARDPFETSHAAAGTPPALGREALSRATAITYALPSASTGFAFFMASIFFLKYATDVLGISAIAMGWVLLVSRFWDAVSDPLMGFLSDRTRTRFGRRRPWMIGAAVPLGLLIVALWSPPGALTGGGLIAWTCVVYLLLYTAMTAFNVPYDAIGAELSSDYHERNRIFGLRRIAFGVGALAALGGVALLSRDDLASEVGKQAARADAFGISVAAGMMATVLVLFTALRLRERPEYRDRGSRHPIQAVTDVWRNPRARVLLTVFFVQQIGVTALVLMVPFFIDYVLEAPGQIAPVLLAFMVSATLSIPVWVAAARRFEKKTLLITAMLGVMAAMAPGFLLGPGDLAWAFGCVVVAGFSSGATDTLFPSLQADVIDVDEHLTGERKEGVYFAVWNFASKTAGSGVGVIVGFALSAAGYVPNVQQSESASWMIRFLYAGLPLVCWTIGILLFLRFHLTAREHAAIRSEIDRGGFSTSPQNPDKIG